MRTVRQIPAMRMGSKEGRKDLFFEQRRKELSDYFRLTLRFRIEQAQIRKVFWVLF
jgi:hypothetical protein